MRLGALLAAADLDAAKIVADDRVPDCPTVNDSVVNDPVVNDIVIASGEVSQERCSGVSRAAGPTATTTRMTPSSGGQLPSCPKVLSVRASPKWSCPPCEDR